MRKEHGISLVALIITIIVLLMIAGVTTTIILGPNGLIQINTENRQTTREVQDRCNHEWLQTSRWDSFKSLYQPISKCSKCGKEI